MQGNKKKDIYDNTIFIGAFLGLYPMLFYMGNNWQLVDYYIKILQLVFVFIIIPIIAYFLLTKVADLILKKIRHNLPRAGVHLVIAIAIFSFYMLWVVNGGIAKTLTIAYTIVAVALGLMLYKHFKKIIIIFQILAITACVSVGKMIKNEFSKNDDWVTDNKVWSGEDFIFLSKPNIYLIQPDGFIGINPAKKTPYNWDTSRLEAYMEKMGFIIQPDYRSNYHSTLFSNSSMFEMAHHYNDAKRTRSHIIQNNAVLDQLELNGYQTHLLSTFRFFASNGIDPNYDTDNFGSREVIGIRFNGNDPLADLKKLHEKVDESKPQFYFIQNTSPNHIKMDNKPGQTSLTHKDDYLNRIEDAADWLEDATTEILRFDPNALIIIAADHGGYVGLDYGRQIYEGDVDPSNFHSVFGSLMAIKWNGEQILENDNDIPSAVSLFPYVFSKLSGRTYDATQYDHSSYATFPEDSKIKLYKLIDSNNHIVDPMEFIEAYD